MEVGVDTNDHDGNTGEDGKEWEAVFLFQLLVE